MSAEIDGEELKRKISIANERAKLEGTAANNIGIAVFTAGVIVPVLAWAYDLPTRPNLSGLDMIGSAAFWALIAFIAHQAGKGFLGQIR